MEFTGLLNNDIKTKWIEALRSGDYDITPRQIQFVHVRADGGHTFNGIGVLMDILPHGLVDWRVRRNNVAAFSRFCFAAQRSSIASDDWSFLLRHPSLYNQKFSHGHHDLNLFWERISTAWKTVGNIDDFIFYLEAYT